MGDHDFALHHGRSREIARIFGDIVDDNVRPLVAAAPQAGVESNAGVGRKAASERPDKQDGQDQLS